MQYKGYTGSVEFSDTDDVFYGKVQGIQSLVSYEGASIQKLEIDFHKAVDEYLVASPGLRAMRKLSESAERNGISDMTLEDINVEINASRAERARKGTP